MNDKQYKSITEVSELLKINKHVIRYWDSKFDGISMRLSNTKRRFFSSKNIKKIKELRDTLYRNGKHNYSLDLAKKILDKDKDIDIKDKEIRNISIDIKALKIISSDLKKLFL
jgi:DNA-binding transcriptional MerR regulator